MQLNQLVAILDAIEKGACLSIGNRRLFLLGPSEFAASITLDNGQERYLPLKGMTVALFVEELTRLPKDDLATVASEAFCHLAASKPTESILSLFGMGLPESQAVPSN